LWAAADSEPLHRLLGAWGAAQLAIRTPGADLLAALEAGRPTPGAAVLRTNPFALALQRFVGAADAFTDGESALDAAIAAGLPLHEREFLVRPAWYGRRDFDSTARVLAASERADRVELAVETAAEALLVVATTFDPGWRAEADGRPVAIHETAAGYQALILPAGSRDVVLRYRERWLPAGAAISGVAWLVLGALALASRRHGD
jgi:hypothetical protein